MLLSWRDSDNAAPAYLLLLSAAARRNTQQCEGRLCPALLRPCRPMACRLPPQRLVRTRGESSHLHSKDRPRLRARRRTCRAAARRPRVSIDRYLQHRNGPRLLLDWHSVILFMNGTSTAPHPCKSNTLATSSQASQAASHLYPHLYARVVFPYDDPSSTCNDLLYRWSCFW